MGQNEARNQVRQPGERGANREANPETNQQAAVLVGADLPNLGHTLPELLVRAAQGRSGIRHVGSHNGSHSREVCQSYADLLRDATGLLKRLRTAGLRPQDPVILHFAESQAFLTGIWGCFLGGFVPVPIAVAPDYETETSKTALLRHAVELLNQPLILTDRAEPVRGYWQRAGGAARVMALGPAEVGAGDGEDWGEFYRAEPEALALLLLTSGSTGQPKGVKLTGRNLLAAAYGMATTNQIGPAAVCLNWMPLEHVASLVMFHLTQVYVGCEQIQVEHGAVLQAPLQWLDWVNQYRVSHTWAPNFAYGLIAERADEIERRHWDLSCLRWMGNGAEAVVGKTTRRFLELLAAQGLGEVVCPGYGMSETCAGIVHSHEFSRSGQDDGFVEVGLPIAGVAVRIVDAEQQPVAVGEIGRLQVRGATVMQGYYQRPDLDAAVFTADGWFDTGDLGLIRAGRLTITGRQRAVIVVNGANYYNHEIEAVVEELAGVAVSFTAACAVRLSGAASEQLAVFFCQSQNSAGLAALVKAIRRQVVQQIGISVSYVVPVEPSEVPKTSLGKIQHSELSRRFEVGEFDARVQQVEAALAAAQQVPQTQLEQKIAQIWQQVLGLPVGRQDNFFELGGNSLLLMQVLQRLQEIQPTLTATALFQYSTVAALGQYLADLTQPEALHLRQRVSPVGQADVAIIGMACRFPGANSIGQFWENLCAGVESITFFSDAEILAAGVDAELLNRPEYVKASPILDCDIAEFDAEFFGYSPREASLLDPQQRLLLECAWESLEDAGYNPFDYSGAIGLYAGASMNTYLLNQIYPNRHQLDENDSLNVVTLSSMGGFQLTTANDKDYLTTRVSYKLNLTGPSMNVQTACSTSLVAIHLARQSLLHGECDMALAGGVSVHVPQQVGHLYQDGMILTSDGHCRAFDAAASGTIFGSGAGLVVLKRLDQAIADRDRVYAVIRGSAVANDGGEKVGYFAPKASGQALVTAEAMRCADINPETIGYVEAHGTGTVLGDPIEIAGLTQAFRLGTERQQFCAIGSVKTNVGHLNIASGVVGLIKAALCLYHKQIPPSLHFNQPNPQIDFTYSPFYVNRALKPWPRSEHPRRAGVNSLGIGGTNAHMILEELDVIHSTQPETLPQIFTVSAKTPAALASSLSQYQQFLAAQPADFSAHLSDLCFTAHVGRAQLEQRWSRVITSLPDLQRQLQLASKQPIPATPSQPQVALLFPGQGSHYAGMGQELYQICTVFRAAIDRCSELVQLPLVDLFKGELSQTSVAQPALFAIEYGLAQVWLDWGIRPAAVVGHSLGEYVAACVAGVLSLEDALNLVMARAQLMQALPPGNMVAVMAEETAVRAILQKFGDLEIAAINGKANIVISGSGDAIEKAIAYFAEQGIITQTLDLRHAFHSRQVEPMLAEFEAIARQVTYNAPKVPLIASLTGTATAEVATADYWGQQLRQPVQFARAMATLHQFCQLWLECGPKPTLLGLAQADYPEAVGLPSLHPKRSDWDCLLHSLSELYNRGVAINWSAFHRDSAGRRISLPHYPFQRQRYWYELIPKQQQNSPQLHPLIRQYIPSPITPLFQIEFSSVEPVYLGAHRVGQDLVLPAAALIELAFAAGALLLKTTALTITQLQIHRPLLLPASAAPVIAQLLFHKQNQTFEIYHLDSSSDAADLETWHLQASGQIEVRSSSAPSLDLNALEKMFLREHSAAAHYHQCQQQGLHYGFEFQALQHLWSHPDGKALGKIQLAAPIALEQSPYHLHPVLLDAALQVVAAALPDSLQTTGFLPVQLAGIHLFQSALQPRLNGVINSSQPQASYWSYVQLEPCDSSSNLLTAQVELFDPAGQKLAKIERLLLQRTHPATVLGRPNPTPLAWQNWLYHLEWRSQERSQTDANSLDGSDSLYSPNPDLWLIFTPSPLGQSELGRHLTAQLRSANQDCLIVLPNEHDSEQADGIVYLNLSQPQEFEQLLVEVGQRGRLRGVIVLVIGPVTDLENATGNRADSSSGSVLLTTIQQSCETSLHVIQALANVVLPHLPRLWLVTSGAQAVGTRSVTCPDQACLWGLGRVMALEHPEFLPTRIDLDPAELAAASEQVAAKLLREIWADSPEDQIGFAAGQRYVARLAHLPTDEFLTNKFLTDEFLTDKLQTQPQTQSPPQSQTQLQPQSQAQLQPQSQAQLQPQSQAQLQPQSQAQNSRLEIREPGSLAGLIWRKLARRTPAANEVEIRVRATGLNFRDLMNALGLYPGEAGPLGLECAGEIVAVGAAVNQFALGDPVMAIAPGSFSQYVTVAADLVAPCPQSVNFAAAATLPAAFLTAYQALIKLGQLKPGQRVLIHAAAGGVGQAAVQLAQRIGAEIIATAAPGKWQFLQAQGIQTLFSSRSPDFVEAIRSAGGVDLVLNSLSGEFISASLAVLRPQGCFIEIGKAGIWLPQQIAALRPDVSYHVVDLMQITQQQPNSIQALFQQLLPRFELDLQPLPQTVFPAAQITDAFRYMQQAKQMGKIVVLADSESVPLAAATPGSGCDPANLLAPSSRLRPNASYLIAGGLGALGLAVAQRLVERGAKHLVLVGRSAPSPSVRSRLADLQAKGVQLDLIQADLGQPEILAQLQPFVPRLAGVIQAAGCLDDGVLTQQTWQRFATVMAAKVQGSWFLHQLTQNQPLDFFVLFSSAASLLGSAGQANYAAANAFLDGLAHYRRALGLPGLSINWGAWSLGMAAGQTLEPGWSTIALEPGLEILEALLVPPAVGPQVGVLPVDWQLWRPALPLLQDFTAADRSAEEPVDDSMMQQLQTTPEPERFAQLAAYLSQQIGKILGLATVGFDPHQGLSELGMDSLTSVELRNLLQKSLGCRLPSTLLFDYPTLATLTNYLLKRPELAPAPAPAVPTFQPSDLQDLSEAEAEAMLLQALEQLEQ